jgi:hypothetical protein
MESQQDFLSFVPGYRFAHHQWLCGVLEAPFGRRDWILTATMARARSAEKHFADEVIFC